MEAIKALFPFRFFPVSLSEEPTERKRKKMNEPITPIGVFDSGYGGLTILREIQRTLPQYDLIYLGDNARAPYGNRSYDVVYRYTLESVRKLFALGCPLIILACNTASAKALRTIQQRDLPGMDAERRVLGVIRPTVESVVELSRNGHIGLLGTVGTVASLSYPMELEKLEPGITVTGEACPLWASIVEAGEADSEGADYFVRKNIEHLFEQDGKIDTLILGCTHYPLLLKWIRKHVPTGVRILSQGDLVAKSLADYLHRHPEMEIRCSKGGTTRYYTTESPDRFVDTASIFLGHGITAEHIDLE